MKHTPEPWEVTLHGFYADNPGEPWVSINRGAIDIGGLRFHENDVAYERFSINDSETRLANARRIVQCVNACAGIKDPAQTIEDLRGALEFILKNCQLYGPADRAREKAREALRELP